MEQSCVITVDCEIRFLSAAAYNIIPLNTHSAELAFRLSPIRLKFSALIMKESMKCYFWNVRRWTLWRYLQNSGEEAKDIPDIFSPSRSSNPATVAW